MPTRPDVPRRPHALARAGFALAATLVAAGLRLSVDGLIGRHSPFLTFTLAVLATSWYGGFRAGLLATGLGAFAGGAIASLGVGWSQADTAQLALFVAVGVLISAMANRLTTMRDEATSRRAALERSDRFHGAIADLSADFAWRARVVDGGRLVIEEATEGFARMLGYSVQELSALGWDVVLHPDDRIAAQRIVGSTLAGETVTGELRVRSRAGRAYLLRFTTQPESDASGRVVQVYGAAHDVTAQREAESARDRNELQWRQLADAMPQIVFAARPDGYIDYFNARWYAVTGAPAGELGSATLERVLHPDESRECLEAYASAIARGLPFDRECRFWDATRRQYRWFLGRALPVRGPGGAIERWYGTCTDIDDMKRAEALLRESDRRKDEFLAMLAHELRNPLNPIKSAIAVMRSNDAGDGDVEWSRDVVERQVEHLSRLIDDLLDVSRITRGKLELRTEPLELERIVADAAEATRPLLERHHHALELSLPPEPVLVRGDAVRLAQVFTNLLNNAAKYTPDGGRIALRAAREREAIVVEVHDTGIGLAPADLPRVFDAFYQVDDALDRREGGLGIGLTLVQQIVAMHGGEVEARSDGPGRGAVFTVRLPALREAANAAMPPRLEQRELPPSHILVADDNRDSADSIAMLLSFAGHDVEVAYDGEQAVAAAERRLPQIALLDLGMPKLNGYDVCKRLREMPGGEEIVIVAQTGWGAQRDRELSAEAGFDAHHTKPIDFDGLMHSVRRIATSKRAVAAPARH